MASRRTTITLCGLLLALISLGSATAQTRGTERVKWRFQMDSWLGGRFVTVAPDGTVYASDLSKLYALTPDRATPERMDLVSLDIEFIALLSEKERVAELSADESTSDCIGVCRNARQSFVCDHAGWWMPTFGRRLDKRANMLYESDPQMGNDLRKMAGVAQILCVWIAVERILTDVAPRRRIICPSVAPQETDNDCGSCGLCSQEVTL